MFNAEQAYEVAQDAMETLFTDSINREVFASSNQLRIRSALLAYIRLNSQDKIMEEIVALPATDAGFHEGLKRLKRHLEEVFLTLYDSGKLVLDTPLTTLGQQALAKMRSRVASTTAIPRSSVAGSKPEAAA